MSAKGQRRPTNGIVIVLLDVVAICVGLVVFSLFHHVLPRAGGEAMVMIVDVAEKPIVAQSVVKAMDAPAPTASERVALPVAAPATMPTAVPIATPAPRPGDFSATFPAYDTGIGALHSYQSDGLRIAIRKVQAEGNTYYAADVWVRDISTFRTAFAGGQYGRGFRDEPAAMAQENGAILAVNGDYYGARGKGIVIRNGQLYRDRPWDGVAVLYRDGTLETPEKTAFDIDSAVERKAYQAWSFGPALLQDGQAIDDFDDAIQGANPRCAVGYYEPGHYVLVVVDGRQPGYSDGMTLVQLSLLMADLGCQTAYNLDGGQTATMVFNGEVVNQPAGGGRRCSDILYFAGRVSDEGAALALS